MDMTVNTCIALADMLAPNDIDAALKRRWLGEIDGNVRVDLMGQSTADASADTEDGVLSETASLTVPYPFDRLYWMYLVAMIAYTQNDLVGYTNAATMFNAAYERYAKWVQRGGV
jgi:hypothetical protein